MKALGTLQKKYGETKIFEGIEDVIFLSTGALIVDQVTQVGGIPYGKVTEIFGHEGTGKTTLGLHLATEVQKSKGYVFWLDFEEAFNRQYAAVIGVNVEQPYFNLLTPDNMEQGEDIINTVIAHSGDTPVLIVIDSVASMQPSIVQEGTLEDAAQIGLQARFLSIMLSRLVKKLKHTNIATVFLNQVRAVIKKSKYEIGPDYESGGGKALKFYASLRLYLEYKGREVEKTESGKIVTCIRVACQSIKNRFGPPLRKGTYFLRLGYGIDNDMSLYEIAKEMDIITWAGGAKFIYKSTQSTKFSFEIKGKEAMLRHLEETLGLKEDIRQTILAAGKDIVAQDTTIDIANSEVSFEEA